MTLGTWTIRSERLPGNCCTPRCFVELLSSFFFYIIYIYTYTQHLRPFHVRTDQSTSGPPDTNVSRQHCRYHLCESDVKPDQQQQQQQQQRGPSITRRDCRARGLNTVDPGSESVPERMHLETCGRCGSESHVVRSPL